MRDEYKTIRMIGNRKLAESVSVTERMKMLFVAGTGARQGGQELEVTKKGEAKLSSRVKSKIIYISNFFDSLKVPLNVSGASPFK